MKVLDLHCEQGHVFEGWFGSENDSQSQLERGLVTCPMCSSPRVQKALSAPRINLGAKPTVSTQSASHSIALGQPSTPGPVSAEPERLRALQAAWLQVTRSIVQQTEDVGPRFAEEARRMHRGEVEERGIRGQATPREALELRDEGIDVMPLALPEFAKETLQ